MQKASWRCTTWCHLCSKQTSPKYWRLLTHVYGYIQVLSELGQRHPKSQTASGGWEQDWQWEETVLLSWIILLIIKLCFLSVLAPLFILGGGDVGVCYITLCPLQYFGMSSSPHKQHTESFWKTPSPLSTWEHSLAYVFPQLTRYMSSFHFLILSLHPSSSLVRGGSGLPIG